MSLELHSTLQSEHGAVGQFLKNVFGFEDDTSFDPELLRWKYSAPHPDWDGPRSFVLREAQRIVAHVGVHPVSFLSAGQIVSGMQLTDWAADKEFAGAGAMIYNELMKRTDTVLAPARAKWRTRCYAG